MMEAGYSRSDFPDVIYNSVIPRTIFWRQGLNISERFSALAKDLHYATAEDPHIFGEVMGSMVLVTQVSVA